MVAGTLGRGTGPCQTLPAEASRVSAYTERIAQGSDEPSCYVWCDPRRCEKTSTKSDLAIALINSVGAVGYAGEANSRRSFTALSASRSMSSADERFVIRECASCSRTLVTEARAVRFRRAVRVADSGLALNGGRGTRVSSSCREPCAELGGQPLDLGRPIAIDRLEQRAVLRRRRAADHEFPGLQSPRLVVAVPAKAAAAFVFAGATMHLAAVVVEPGAAEGAELPVATADDAMALASGR